MVCLESVSWRGWYCFASWVSTGAFARFPVFCRGTLAAVGHPGSRQPNPPGISSEAEGSNQYRGWAVRKSVSVVIATLAMVFSVSAPAAAADANDHASCAGLAGASRAGEPGAEAEVVHGVLESGAFPPGLVNFSDFASFHDGSAEACLA